MNINGFKKGVQDVILITKRPEMSILPGHLAFFLVLAIVPLFLIAIIVTNHYIGSATVVIEFIETNFPQDVGRVLLEIMSKNRFDLSTGLFLLVILFVASGGLYSVVVSANALYGNDAKNVFVRRIKSIFMTVLVFIIFFFMLVFMAFGNNIVNFLSNYINNDLIMNYINMVLLIMRWPVSFLVILFVVNIIYTIAPDNNIKSKSTFIGALVTTITWIIATTVYSFWVDNFASYDIIYGSLSAIIVLMMWVYVLSYFLILGLAINANIYKRTIKG